MSKIKISISEVIKRIGSERTYYRYVKAGLLPICREKKHHPFHLEIHFEILEQNLRDQFESHKKSLLSKNRRGRLTAVEKIMLA